MEVRTIKAEELETLESLTQAVEYYRQIQEELSRLELSKRLAREAILEKFRETGMRYFDTGSGLRARTYTIEGKKYINVAEAKALLDEDTFNKLLKQGETVVVLSVRQIKSEEGKS